MNIKKINILELKEEKKDKKISYKLITSKQDIKDLDLFLEKQSIEPIKNIKKSGKKVAVMYSGGYDSTCLIIKNLELGNEVYPIEVIFNYDESFLKRITLFKLQQIYGTSLLHGIIEIGNYYKSLSDNFERSGLSQQPICVFNAAFIPADIMQNISEIQIGYVMCDYAISFLPELCQLYKLALAFKMYPENILLPEIMFPLSKTTHEDTIEYVLNWSAENKIFLPCTSCDNLNMRARKVNKNIYEYNIEECNCCHKCKTQSHRNNFKIKVFIE